MQPSAIDFSLLESYICISAYKYQFSIHSCVDSNFARILCFFIVGDKHATPCCRLVFGEMHLTCSRRLNAHIKYFDQRTYSSRSNWRFLGYILVINGLFVPRETVSSHLVLQTSQISFLQEASIRVIQVRTHENKAIILQGYKIS